MYRKEAYKDTSRLDEGSMTFIVATFHCRSFILHLRIKKNVMCYNQMIVAIVDMLTSFIFIFTNDNR
jgi:hypothetical protein